MHISELKLGDRVVSKQGGLEYTGIVNAIRASYIRVLVNEGDTNIYEIARESKENNGFLVDARSGIVMCASGLSDGRTELEFFQNPIVVCLVCKQWCDNCECGFCKIKRSAKSHKK